MKPTSNNNEKSKANIQEEEENLSSDIPKEKNLERFIYYTTYNDINFIEKINPLFEEINQKAFNLRSPKEIEIENGDNKEMQKNGKEDNKIESETNIEGHKNLQENSSSTSPKKEKQEKNNLIYKEFKKKINI